MQKVLSKLKNAKRLPAGVKWLIGYVAVLGCAAALVYGWRMLFLLPASFPAVPATLITMAVFSLLYGALYMLCHMKAENLALKAAIVVFILGLLFCFGTAPLQVPDEANHYLRSVSISLGRFNYDYNERYPEDVNVLVNEFAHPMNHAVLYAGGQLAGAKAEEYRQNIADDVQDEEVQPPIMYMLLPFLPQALFMALARLLGFSALGLMYAGRLANLLLYALISYATFKNCSRYRGVFIAFSLLPLSLFMAASCSYDSLMLALCFYMLSFLCKQKVQTKDAVLFCAALAFCTYVKLNNVLLCMVLLLISKEAWQLKRLKRWMVMLCALGAAFVLWYGLGSVLDGTVLKQNWPATLPRGSGVAADPAGQLVFVLKNPLRFVAVVVLSVLEADGWIFDLGRLGSMDLVLPMVGGLSVLVLAFGMVASARARENTARRLTAGLVLLALFYTAFVLAGMYVLDTDYTSIRITGPQPRYFLPAFLLLCMAGSIALGKGLRPRLGSEGGSLKAEYAALWIAAALAVFAAMLLVQSTYIGQWVPKSEGGWKLINLYGWVQR